MEAKSREVELHEDQLKAVECMVEFFYTGDYCHEHKDDSIFRCSEELNAYVYATAEKYEVPLLKELALEKFKEAAESGGKQDMLIATKAVYEDILLPDHDRKLREATLGLWMASGLDDTDHTFVLSALADSPAFAADLTLRLLADRKQTLVSMNLTESEAHHLAVRSEVFRTLLAEGVKHNVDRKIEKQRKIIAEKDAEIERLKSTIAGASSLLDGACA